MATNKKKMFIYLSQEMVDDVEIGYRMWSLIQKRRGLTPSMSKWIESVLKRHIDVHREEIDAFKGMRKKFVKDNGV